MVNGEFVNGELSIVSRHNRESPDRRKGLNSHFTIDNSQEQAGYLAP